MKERMNFLTVKITNPYKFILDEQDVRSSLVNYFKKHRFEVHLLNQLNFKFMPVKKKPVKKKAAKKAAKKKVMYRSAITGKLITKEKALKNPDTSVKETARKK